MSEQEMDDFFDSVDTDHDKTVSIEEYMHVSY